MAIIMWYYLDLRIIEYKNATGCIVAKVSRAHDVCTASRRHGLRRLSCGIPDGVMGSSEKNGTRSEFSIGLA